MLDRVDTGSLPMTEPHPSPIFDTGPHPDPLVSYDTVDTVDYTPPADPVSPWHPDAGRTGPHLDLGAVISADPPATPAPPQLVPGQFHFVKRWKFALLLAGVWIAAGVVGLGLYYWWFHAVDKTWPDVAVLGFVIVCIVAGLLVSMTESRPMLSALSVAIMSAPFAAACAAGALYGAYAFGWVAP